MSRFAWCSPLGILMLTACAEPPPSANVQGAFLSGRITTLAGEPVGDAEVWIEDSKDQQSRGHGTRTDDFGRFRMGPLEPVRSVTLWAESNALAREQREGIAIFPGMDHFIGDLQLAEGTICEGRVSDDQGRGLRDVTVRIVSLRHVLAHSVKSNGPSWNVSCDQDGRVQTPPLPPGSVTFVFSAPEKSRKHVYRTILPGVRRIDLDDIVLEDDLPISGHVVDETGRPIRGAALHADYDYENAVETGDTGSFVLRGCNKNAAKLTVTAPGYDDLVYSLKDERSDLRVTLKRAVEICGRVVDEETGEPVRFDNLLLCTVRRDKDGSLSLFG